MKSQLPPTYKNKGIFIAKLLWPELTLEPEGSFWDKFYGVDAYLDGDHIQIKFDSRITSSGNIYHEIYEKSEGRPNQPWRGAISKGATHYIFTTENDDEYWGIRLPVDHLAESERGMKLTLINPNGLGATSMGYLLPIEKLVGDVQRHFKLGGTP